MGDSVGVDKMLGDSAEKYTVGMSLNCTLSEITCTICPEISYTLHHFINTNMTISRILGQTNNNFG